MINKNRNLLFLFLGILLVSLVVFMIFGDYNVIAKVIDKVPIDVKVEKIDIFYAVEGKLDKKSEGEDNSFVFGAVRLYKVYEFDSSQGIPPGKFLGKWTPYPIFYLEIGDKKTAMKGKKSAIRLFRDSFKVRQFYGSFSCLEFLKYNEDKVYEEEDSKNFEIHLVFTENGKIDIDKSSISIVPPEDESGRYIVKYLPTGKFYKKGSDTELFVPILNEENKQINRDERGEPILDYKRILIHNVCYDIEGDIFEGNFENTGLCETYKISNILNSTGTFPDGYRLGIISDK